MRAVVTVLLGAISVIAFVSFFTLSSLFGYLSSPDEMMETARESDAHGAGVEIVTQGLRDELAQGVEPAFERYVTARAAEAADKAIPEQWFYSTFEGALTEVLARIEADAEAQPAAHILRLGEVRDRLRQELLAIGREVRADCARLTQSPVCADAWATAELVRAYENAVGELTERIPAQTSLPQLAAASGRDWLEPGSSAMVRVRTARSWARLVRWASLGVLLVSLGLLAWLHRAALPRLLLVLGVVITVAAVTHFVTLFAAERLAAELVERERERDRLALNAQARAVAPAALAGVERLAVRASRDALHGSNAPVIVLLAGGVGAIVSGLLGRRRPVRRST